MFKKPNRTLRVRKAESSEDEEEETLPEQLVDKRQKRVGSRGLACGTRDRKTVHAAKIASYADEDEEESNSEPEDADINEDFRKQRRAGGPHSLLSFTEEKEGEEVSFQIKKPSVNTFVFKAKKKSKKEDHEKEQENSDSFELESDHSSESEHPQHTNSPPLKKDSSESAASSPSLSPGDIEVTAQVKSQMPRTSRQLAAQGDYLSLGVLKKGRDSSQSESDDEQDDHERRICFAPGTKTLKDQMAEEISASSDSGEEKSKEDEDFQDQWEEQQIRKAIKYPEILDNDLLPVRNTQNRRNIEPRFSLPPVNIGDIKKKLTASITSLEEVHQSHVHENEKYTRDLESSKHSLEMLGKSVSEQSYKFFKEMKTYVENFVDCMNEKIIQINKLECEMFTLFENRAKDLLHRRQNDLRNESAVLQKLSGKNTDIEDATKGVLEDSYLRRNKRRKKRELLGINDHCEGMSSDDEMPSEEETSFKESRARVLFESKDLFEDVHEDFHRVKNALSKFQEWRQRFPESYYDAYISLCIPKLLNPLIRVHLLDWNPLENITDLEKLEWYHDLEEFCYSSEDPETHTEDSPDNNVLSAVVEKSILPKVSEFIDHVWDPLSATQTSNLVRFCKTYVLESESKKAVQELLNSLESRLKKAIEDDVFIPLYPKSILEDRASPHSKFQERQFWSAVKMLQNVLSWDGFLEEETLRELGLDKLLNRYLLLILLNSSPGKEMVNKCSKIVACLPHSWFKGLDSGSSLPCLANFSKHMLQCAHTLHSLDDRENLLVLVSLLKKIKAMDNVEALSSKYNIEELK
ncbi:GC-rich sequence DNA-binding factor 2 [Pelobates cultripes]|uniref:GC-rich sequence DNA-binding factor 2 n=2 Tax=Pelobates cultripes TaxID=61616 RepID=A0AAD1VSX6_PELCU|nr:GC-rich sequence DNA-binding factor 2 [Pelobates cultripes]